MAKKRLSVHQKAVAALLAQSFTYIQSQATRSNNQSVTGAVQDFTSQEERTPQQYDELVLMVDTFLAGNAKYAAACKAEAAKAREAGDLDPGEPIPQGQARVFDGQGLNNALVNVRAGLLVAKSIEHGTYAPPATA